MSEYLSIEEAANRLGISVATARRWAASGAIAARKSGKQWVVDGSRLPARRRTRQAKPRAQLDFARALAHVRTTDLGEPTAPDVLRYADELEDKASLLTDAAVRFEQGPGPPIEVEVDKDALFTRRTIMIDLDDRVAYQAAVGAIAKRVEANTPEVVFSARLSDEPRYFLKRGTTLWVNWRHAALKQIVPGREWMVATDLTSYFDTIPHRALLAEIESLNVDPDIVASLRRMLTEWSATEGYGVPQGPNASRLLGNLYLLPVDRAMLEGDWVYSRYLDDVRIIAATRAEAVQALREFQQECRKRGLIVSAAKTEFLHGEEARASLLSMADLDAVEYLMEANASNLARKQLKAILRNALKVEANLDVRRARFSLYRLASLREGGVLRSVMSHLEDLAPVASVVAAYLQPFIIRRSVVRRLGDFLADPERSYSPHLVAWLLAVMLEHPGKLPEQWVDQATKRLKNKNEPVYLRAIAAIVVARGGRRADIAWIGKDIQREHDPAVLRGYAVGLHWANALGKQTQRQLISRSPRLEKTIAYLQGRTKLPSLVFRDRTIEVMPT
jgi:excisionase family DNA binding protein